MSRPRYERLKEQRRRDRMRELAARVGHLAQQIFELDHSAGRPPDRDTIRALHEVSRIMRQSDDA
jgi:hypothetical protein